MDFNKMIIMRGIENKDNTLMYDYEVSEDIKKLLNIDNKLKIEYSDNISSVPYEIACIPFITGILPMIYLEDITVFVDKIDMDFYNAFDSIREGYKKMLPKGEWKGKIIAKEIIDHSDNSEDNKYSQFFSGGLDSTSTLVSNIDKKPDLITIWGSDILQSNEKSWNVAKNTTINTAEQFNLRYHLINSNFRFYLNENALTTKYRDLLPSSWWYDVQHGAALLGHVAPLAFINKIKTHFIPATHNQSEKNVVCASYPTLDEKMCYCGCNVIHDGFDKTRVQKVENVVEYSNKNDCLINLRVCCTEREEELNCCRCEKCYRTIMEILACKEQPRKYGFDIDDKQIQNIKKFLKNYEMQDMGVVYWKETQEKMLDDKKYFKKIKPVKWMLKYNFDKIKIKDFSKEVWKD